jgi:WD40 repeat protein
MDKTLKFTKISQGKYTHLASINLSSKVYSLIINEDATKMLTCPYDQYVKEWDISEITNIKMLKFSSLKSYSSFDSPFDTTQDLKTIFFISKSSDTHRLLVSQNFTTCKYKSFPKHKKEILTVCYCPKRSWLLSSGRDSTLKVYNAFSGKLRISKQIKDATNVYTIKISQDLRFIFVGVDTQFLYVYCAETFKLIKKCVFPKNVFCISEVSGKVYYSGWVTKEVNVFDIKLLN